MAVAQPITLEPGLTKQVAVQPVASWLGVRASSWQVGQGTPERGGLAVVVNEILGTA